MANVDSYWLIWAVYLSASTVFFAVFWRATRFRQMRWLSYLLRAVATAVIFTPWYASSDGDVLAPALIVILLDAITVGPTAAARATVPLVLAVLFSLAVAAFLLLFTKERKLNKY